MRTKRIKSSQVKNTMVGKDYNILLIFLMLDFVSFGKFYIYDNKVQIFGNIIKERSDS